MTKKIDRDSLKMVLVLTIIALVAALILSVVYNLVYKTDDELFKQKISKLYTASQPAEVINVAEYKNMQYTVINNACTFEDGNTGVVVHSKKAYDADGLKLFVVFSPDGEILSLTSYAHSETPGIGSKALDKAHLDKFLGKNATDFAVRLQDGNSDTVKEWSLFSVVDSVTGATKTSTGVEYAVVGACQFFADEVLYG